MATGFTLESLDAKEKGQVKALRGKLSGFARELGIARDKAATLAPTVKRLFKNLDAKYDCGFIGFARMMDPSIPEKAEDYRKHRTYAALDYVRRVWMQQDRPEGAGRGRKDPATDPVARFIATLLQVVKTPDPIYAAVKREFRMGDRGIAQLKTRVDVAEPLIKLTGIRAVAVAESAIVHMEPTPKGTESGVVVDVEAAAERAMPRGKARRAA